MTDEPLRGPAADLVVAFCLRIGTLADALTFCGGNCAQLLVTDRGALRVRPTDDLDAIAAVTTRTQFDGLRESLARVGVVVDSIDGAPTCRFRTPEGLAVDIMPADERVLGMRSDWFPEAIETAARVRLESSSGTSAIVCLASAPAFLALKWSAHADRGNDDPMMSHDVEDIVTVVAGRPTTGDELERAPVVLRAYVSRSFRSFIVHPDFASVIEDAVPDARRLPELRSSITTRIRGGLLLSTPAHNDKTTFWGTNASIVHLN